MKMFEFEEERSNEDLAFWFRYVHRYGVDHLVNKYHYTYFYKLYDLDIYLILTIVGYVIWRGLKSLLIK
jgi:hypothetical protein